MRWNGDKIQAASYTCANCGRDINSDYGMALLSAKYQGTRKSWYASRDELTENELGIGVYICTNCGFPTFIGVDDKVQQIQIPQSAYGSDIDGVSESVGEIYSEARHSYGVGAYTGVVELCRSLLNHVAVDLGAPSGKSFLTYVNYLDEHHFISVKSRDWVDRIRKLGNEANHDLTIFTQNEAKMCLKFVEMILKTNYEYPSLLEDD